MWRMRGHDTRYIDIIIDEERRKDIGYVLSACTRRRSSRKCCITTAFWRSVTSYFRVDFSEATPKITHGGFKEYVLCSCWHFSHAHAGFPIYPRYGPQINTRTWPTPPPTPPIPPTTTFGHHLDHYKASILLSAQPSCTSKLQPTYLFCLAKHHKFSSFYPVSNISKSLFHYSCTCIKIYTCYSEGRQPSPPIPPTPQF